MGQAKSLVFASLLAKSVGFLAEIHLEKCRAAMVASLGEHFATSRGPGLPTALLLFCLGYKTVSCLLKLLEVTENP
jgi:hypothetical protein